MAHLDDKFNQLMEDIQAINITLAKYEVLQEQYVEKLDVHMHQEERHYRLFQDYYHKTEEFKDRASKDIIGIKRYILMFKGALWVLSALGALWVIVYQILDLIRH